MARKIRSSLRTLLDSGHCEWHTTLDLQPVSVPTVYLSSGDEIVSGTNYLPKLEEIEPLEMELTRGNDQIQYKVENVDQLMGQSVTGATNELNGARGIVGVVFINEETGAVEIDKKMPGQVLVGDITDKDVSMKLISDVDAVIISGRTFASAFPWREPVTLNRPAFSPTGGTIGTGGGGGYGPIGSGGDSIPLRPVGRYGEFEVP
jgi:hypothetical protein